MMNNRQIILIYNKVFKCLNILNNMEEGKYPTIGQSLEGLISILTDSKFLFLCLALSVL